MNITEGNKKYRSRIQYEQDIDRIDSLIQEGKNIDEKNQFGQTALMIAVERRYVDIVQKLLEYGADIHVRDNDGLTLNDYLNKKYLKQTGIEKIRKLFDEYGGNKND